MERPRKRQRAESENDSPYIPPYIRSFPTTSQNIPDYDLRSAIATLDITGGNWRCSFSQRLLLNRAVADPAIAATIRHVFHGYMEAQQGTTIDFSDCVLLLNAVIKARVAMLNSSNLNLMCIEIKDSFSASTRYVLGQTHDCSTLSTKKSALDTLRLLGVALVSTPNGRLLKAFRSHFHTRDTNAYVLGMIDIVRTMSERERMDVARMPVDGATVAMIGPARIGGNRFMDKMLELCAELDDARLLPGLYAVYRELMRWPEDRSDEDDQDHEYGHELGYECMAPPRLEGTTQ